MNFSTPSTSLRIASTTSPSRSSSSSTRFLFAHQLSDFTKPCEFVCGCAYSNDDHRDEYDTQETVQCCHATPFSARYSCIFSEQSMVSLSCSWLPVRFYCQNSSSAIQDSAGSLKVRPVCDICKKPRSAAHHIVSPPAVCSTSIYPRPRARADLRCSANRPCRTRVRFRELPD